MAAHLARRRRRNGLGEEEPDVCAVSGARSLDERGQPEPARGICEGSDVLFPRALVEVDREEPARLVGEHRVDAHDVLATQVPEQGVVVDRAERLVRAVAALHLRQLADAGDELVRARGRVAGLTRLPADEPSRIEIVASAEELPEQLDLLRRGALRHRDRTARSAICRSLVECRELRSKRVDALFRFGVLRLQAATACLLLSDCRRERRAFGRQHRSVVYAWLGRRRLTHCAWVRLERALHVGLPPGEGPRSRAQPRHG